MTIAMKTSAASTSASVNAARVRLARNVLQNIGLNFIVEPIPTLADPNRVAFCLADHNRSRTALRDEPVRSEPDSRRSAIGGGCRLVCGRLIRQFGDLDLKILPQIEIDRFLIGRCVADFGLQTVGAILPVNPKNHRSSLRNRAAPRIMG